MTTTQQKHDFKDGNESVPAHQHVNPDGSIGGWVAETAHVVPTAMEKLRALVATP